jgi:hypothetical protein
MRRGKHLLWIALLGAPACSGHHDLLSSSPQNEQQAPHEQQPQVPEPPSNLPPSGQPTAGDRATSSVEQPPLVELEPEVSIPGAFDGEPTGACRAILHRPGEVVLASASGQERVLDRSETWDTHFADVWALGEYAVVSALEEEAYLAGDRSVAPSLALLHSGAGVLWRGSSPDLGSYLPLNAFH